MANQKNDSYGINADGFVDDFFSVGQQGAQGATVLLEYDIDHPEEILGKTYFASAAEAQNAANLVTMALQFGCTNIKRALSYDLIARNSINQQGRLQYMQCYTMKFDSALYKDQAEKKKSGLFNLKKQEEDQEA